MEMRKYAIGENSLIGNAPARELLRLTRLRMRICCCSLRVPEVEVQRQCPDVLVVGTASAVLALVVIVQHENSFVRQLHAKSKPILVPRVGLAIVEQFTPGIRVKPHASLLKAALNRQLVSVPGGVLPVDPAELHAVAIRKKETGAGTILGRELDNYAVFVTGRSGLDRVAV
jgi:hypothetical protein